MHWKNRLYEGFIPGIFYFIFEKNLNLFKNTKPVIDWKLHKCMFVAKSKLGAHLPE